MRIRSIGAAVLAIAALAACSSSGGSGGGGSGGGSSGGSGADCVSLCSASQAGQCTTITGDCGTFCSALTVVDSEANCESEYDAYESCLGTPATVCGNSCGAQAQALQNCVDPYCGAHSSESSCVTIAGAF
jgi:hypothetical protein